jgi:hypothetical protein
LNHCLLVIHHVRESLAIVSGSCGEPLATQAAS